MDQLQASHGLPTTKGKKWPQYKAAFSASLGCLCAGAVMGWTSPALPYLQGNITDSLDDEEGSWVGATAPLGGLIGALPAGYLADMFGRKVMLLSLSFPFLVSWILIIFAETSVTMLCTARVLGGLTMGAVTVVTSLYNEEICEVEIRGAVGVYLDLMLSVGILWCYVVGAIVSYKWLSIISCVLPVIYFLTFIWMPESPVYLLSRGKYQRAEKAISFLRGGGPKYNYDVQFEISVLKNRLDETTSIASLRTKTVWKKAREMLSKFSFMSPAAQSAKIVFGLMIFQQMSGIDAILFYTVDIFQIAGSSLSAYTCTIIVGVIQVLVTASASLLVERIGRRLLLVISETAMAICLGILAVYFYFKDREDDVSSIGWLPLASVTTFVVAFAVGLGPLPWFMMTEVVPTESRDWINAMAVCINWTLVFTVTKVFSLMLNRMGKSGTFGFFCACCIVGLVFVIVLVPETRGKTLNQIQNDITKNKIPNGQNHKMLRNGKELLSKA